jgi:peptidoglycan hydrolase-like protein with peptidoglycan-binding domain
MMTKTEVLSLQKRLNELGFVSFEEGSNGEVIPVPLEEDGQYGAETENAYRRYLDSLDSSTPTVIPKPDKKWWHSKAAVGSIATVIASVFGMIGYSVDSSFISEMILALITLVTGITGMYGTITRDSSIEKTVLPDFSKKRSRPEGRTSVVHNESKDPRGSFGGDY